MKNIMLITSFLLFSIAGANGIAATMEPGQHGAQNSFSPIEIAASLEGAGGHIASVGAAGFDNDDTTRQWISEPIVLPTIFVIHESDYL